MSNKEVAEKYGVPKNTVSTWLANKEKLFTSFEKSSNKKRNIRNGNFTEVDLAVFKWFVSQRSKNIPIDGILLREKAKMHKNLASRILKPQMVGWVNGKKGKRTQTFFSLFSTLSLINNFDELKMLLEDLDTLFGSNKIQITLDLHAFSISQIYWLSILSHLFCTSSICQL